MVASPPSVSMVAIPMEWGATGGKRKRILKTRRKKKIRKMLKLYGVGPVDNRPSNNELHHFVPQEKKNERKKSVTFDM